MKPIDYELLYDLPDGEYDGRGIGGVRTMTIRAGRTLEVMCYPLIRWSQEAKREAKRRRSTAAMEAVNRRNRERKHMRMIEANFSEAAWVVTLVWPYPVEDYAMCSLGELLETYEKRKLPEEIEDTKRDAKRFVERLRRRLKRETGTAEDLRWDFTGEQGKDPPRAGLPPKYHIHAILEAPGLTREMIEETWRHGVSRCEHLGLSSDGAKRLAHYLNKGVAERKWWSHSRNMVMPVPRISDRKVSRRRLALLAADIMASGPEIFGRLYPEYKLVEEPVVRFSDFVTGAYIYARLRRRE